MIIQTGMRTDIPNVVDLIAFCTKNPTPMLPYMNVLKSYGKYWFVTITPYGRDIEPNVPDKEKVMDDLTKMSDIVGVDSMGWRYDPILVDDKHSVEWHITEFEKMAENMKKHNPMSPFLLGESMPGDVIHEAKQESWIDHQLMLDTLI